MSKSDKMHGRVTPVSDQPMLLNALLPERLQLVVKTFSRPWRARVCCASMAARHPGVRIHLVDDGRPSALSIDGFPPEVTHYRTDFDIGLSAGRNLGVSKVTTPYVAVFDDDFKVTEASPIAEVVEYMETDHPEVDIMCLRLKNNRGETLTYSANLEERESAAGSKFLRRTGAGPAQVDRHKVCHMGFNCMVARTETLRRHQWDPDLKLAEHWDFFLRARDAGLTVGVYMEGWIRHVRGKGSRLYRRYRNRVGRFRRLALRKHGLIYYAYK